jgi:hypothetical protein
MSQRTGKLLLDAMNARRRADVDIKRLERKAAYEKQYAEDKDKASERGHACVRRTEC